MKIVGGTIEQISQERQNGMSQGCQQEPVELTDAQVGALEADGIVVNVEPSSGCFEGNVREAGPEDIPQEFQVAVKVALAP